MYILTSREQNAGQNQDNKTADTAIENIAKFKYLATRVTKLRHEKVMSRLNSGESCNHSVRNIVSETPYLEKMKHECKEQLNR